MLGSFRLRFGIAVQTIGTIYHRPPLMASHLCVFFGCALAAPGLREVKEPALKPALSTAALARRRNWKGRPKAPKAQN